VHEAPEIDGIVHLPAGLRPGDLLDMTIIGAEGPDLRAVPVADAAAGPRDDHLRAPATVGALAP
jgi:hypothetical protein